MLHKQYMLAVIESHYWKLIIILWINFQVLIYIHISFNSVSSTKYYFFYEQIKKKIVIIDLLLSELHYVCWFM